MLCLVAGSASAGMKAVPMVVHPSDDPREDSPMGRVGETWFSDRIISQLGARGLTLTKRAPGEWRNIDFSATMKNGVITATDGYRVATLKPRREANATIYEGTLGLDWVYPLSIRISREAIDMKWGFYERHLKADQRPQTPPECVSYTAGRNAWSTDDSLEVCGEALDGRSAPVQTLIGFLNNGFRHNQAQAPWFNMSDLDWAPYEVFALSMNLTRSTR